MSIVRVLGLTYLVSASAFAMAATFAAHPRLAPLLKRQTMSLADNLRERFWNPAVDLVHREEAILFHQPSQRLAAAPQQRKAQGRGWRRPAITRHDLTGPPIPPFVARADAVILPDLPPLAPPQPARAAAASAPQIGPPSASERAAAQRLKTSLTAEMLKSFDLFLYVSKADKGPLAQRMYVFRKQPDGGLKLLYDWAASTGRERQEISALGVSEFTDTPRGYYELDPNRMYWRYHSRAWNQAMPYSMFFNWQKNGLATGLAIHGASGEDIGRLGRRASAGCVHIAPENAKLLYHLIRADYKGKVPRLAYDRRSATSSNSGAFRHDAAGRLVMADGYKVLVFIEDYGGGNVLAALF
jgi:hypothetical protein